MTNENRLLILQVRGLLQGEARRQRERASLEVPGFGRAGLPFEFWPLIPIPPEVRVVEANTPPSAVLQAIRSGVIVVLTGDFTRAGGILKYLDRMGKGVLDRSVFRNIPNRFDRSRREQAGVRSALYRLMMVVRDGRLRGVTGGPFSPGRDLRPWIEGGEDTPADPSLLIPLRKILRIASDIKRLEEGVFVPSLGAPLVVLPTVFAPVDQKVVSLFDEHVEVADGDRVLDVGTGTGVLALIAARRGAEVAATDRNPEAVSCARLNARRLGLRVEVIGPCDLFDGVRGRRFRHVLFNAPWLIGAPRTAYEAALYDDGGVIGRFFEGVCDHLEPEGTVWLLYGDVFERTGDGALARVKDLLRSRGLTVRRQWRTIRAGRVSGRRETVVLYEVKRHWEIRKLEISDFESARAG